MENQSKIQLIIDKVLNSDTLSAKEIQYLIEEEFQYEENCSFMIVDEKDEKLHRWHEEKISILQLTLSDGSEKLFSIKWKMGLTEQQENEYPEQSLKEVYLTAKYVMYADYKEVNKNEFEKSKMYIKPPVLAFQLGIDPIPDWFDELIKKELVELHDAEQKPSCIIKLEDSNIMGKYSDYIINENMLSVMSQEDFEREYLCIKEV